MFEAYEAEAAEALKEMDIEFPQFRKIYGSQYFKLIDRETVISVRVDDQVSGIGISIHIPWEMFSTIFYYETATFEEYITVCRSTQKLINDTCA